MRYRNIGDEMFTNAKGESKLIYGNRRAERYADVVIQNKERERELDDFAASIWGEGAEILSYRLREQNIEKLLLEEFNEKVFTEIHIPPRA